MAQSGVPELSLFEFDADVPDSTWSHLERLLDDAERDDLLRLTEPLKRRRAFARRGAVRCVLAAYGGMPPELVPIVRDGHGRPSLHAAGGRPTVSFSSSASGARCVFAVSRHCEVGVDVEVPAARRLPAEAARLVLHPGEWACWEGLADHARERWLLACWCAKEALLKGMGIGLLRDPTEFDLLSKAQPLGSDPTIVTSRGPGQWHVQVVSRADAVLAVAHQGPATVRPVSRLQI
jgi:4'-phosphopantetheinyl transferase